MGVQSHRPKVYADCESSLNRTASGSRSSSRWVVGDGTCAQPGAENGRPAISLLGGGGSGSGATGAAPWVGGVEVGHGPKEAVYDRNDGRGTVVAVGLVGLVVCIFQAFGI